MGPVLHGLVKLQRIENRLRAVKAKLARCRKKVTFQESQIRNLENAYKAKHDEMTMTRKKIDSFELELNEREAVIEKYKTALNSAKSNKEYAAILTELNIGKADKSKLETQILELFKVIEQEEAASKEITDEIEALKSRLDNVKHETGEQSKELEEQIDQIEAEWREASGQIAPAILSDFKRIADSYDGEAIAFAEMQDQRRQLYTCSGCYMTLTDETINILMTKDDVIKCPSCGRIVVLNTEE